MQHSSSGFKRATDRDVYDRPMDRDKRARDDYLEPTETPYASMTDHNRGGIGDDEEEKHSYDYSSNFYTTTSQSQARKIVMRETSDDYFTAKLQWAENATARMRFGEKNTHFEFCAPHMRLTDPSHIKPIHEKRSSHALDSCETCGIAWNDCNGGGSSSSSSSRFVSSSSTSMQDIADSHSDIVADAISQQRHYHETSYPMIIPYKVNDKAGRDAVRRQHECALEALTSLFEQRSKDPVRLMSAGVDTITRVGDTIDPILDNLQREEHRAAIAYERYAWSVALAVRHQWRMSSGRIIDDQTRVTLEADIRFLEDFATDTQNGGWDMGNMYCFRHNSDQADWLCRWAPGAYESCGICVRSQSDIEPTCEPMARSKAHAMTDSI